MAEKIYSESDWAVRRWDRFNDRLVKPLSFCHFWRTVLLHETLRQLLSPMQAAGRLARRYKHFTPLGVAVIVALVVGGGGAFSGANLVGSLVLGVILGTVLGILLGFEPKLSEDATLRLGAIHLSFWRGVGHGLWLLAWPFRLFFPPVGRRLVAGVATVGEPVVEYASDHKEGLEKVGTGALIVVCVAMIGFVIVAFLLESWIVTLAVLGVLVIVFLAALIGIPQAFWRFFVAVMGLLWGAAVAAKHGVCPPVTITRREEGWGP